MKHSVSNMKQFISNWKLFVSHFIQLKNSFLFIFYSTKRQVFLNNIGEMYRYYFMCRLYTHNKFHNNRMLI